MSQSRTEHKKPVAGSALLLLVAAILCTAGSLPARQDEGLSESVKALYRGRPVQAASLARKYLQTHPTSRAALILLARAEMAQGKHDSAYLHLWKVLRADPNNIDALYFLSRLAVQLSLAEHHKLYALAPDSARVHQLLAESYRAQENTAKAEEEYVAALQVAPQSIEVLNSLGDLKRSQFKFDEAITYYARATAIQPRDYASAYGLGVCYLYQQEPSRAIAEFRRALVLDSESAPARLALGNALLRVGQVAEAVTELKAAVSLEPDMRQAYTLLARAYSRLGQRQEAEEALKKSEALAQKERLAREQDFVTDGLGPAIPPGPED